MSKPLRDERGRFMSMNDCIRAMAGRHVEVPEPSRPAGVEGGVRAPRERAGVDMKALIRARAGKGAQVVGYAANGLPLQVE